MGELARKPGAPKLPETPEELLTAGVGEGFTVLEKHLPPIITGAVIALGPALSNWKLRRPWFAGIHRHILFGAVGYMLGDWIFSMRRAQRSEKDAILLHYISLHPEDFPPIERQRYKDVFLPWVPRR